MSAIFLISSMIYYPAFETSQPVHGQGDGQVQGYGSVVPASFENDEGGGGQEGISNDSFVDDNAFFQDSTGDLDEGAFGMETMEDTVASGGSGTLITYPNGTTCDPAFTFCPNILH
jgi:hypothetical protein